MGKVVPIVQVDGPCTKPVFGPLPTRSDGQTGFEINVEDVRPGKIVTYQVFVSREYGIGQGAGSYIAALAGPDGGHRIAPTGCGNPASSDAAC